MNLLVSSAYDNTACVCQVKGLDEGVSSDATTRVGERSMRLCLGQIRRTWYLLNVSSPCEKKRKSQECVLFTTLSCTFVVS